MPTADAHSVGPAARLIPTPQNDDWDFFQVVDAAIDDMVTVEAQAEGPSE